MGRTKDLVTNNSQPTWVEVGADYYYHELESALVELSRRVAVLELQLNTNCTREEAEQAIKVQNKLNDESN